MEKISTGIAGLDNILDGGYAKGRITVLKGGPGCGKTVFCLLFANQNIKKKRQVTFITCDESPGLITENMNNYGFNATDAINRGKLNILDFRPSFTDQVVGEFELEAILLRVKNSLSGKAGILIIDSLQNLLIGIKKDHIMSLLTLFTWCRDNDITLLATATADKAGKGDDLLEEYASDCVILIEQLMCKNLMTRFLHVLKLRGSAHGTNRYPFLLTENGVSVFPITDAQLNRKRQQRYLSTGIKKLDVMLGKKGYREASSIMISGASGTAKSLLASTIAETATHQKKKVLYVSYEESTDDFIKNIKSVGIDFRTPMKEGLLQVHCVRAIEMGLEEHLIFMVNLIDDIKPSVFIVDPITSLLDLGSSLEVKSLLVRFISYLKARNVTIIFTELLHSADDYRSIVLVSSLVDIWIELRLIETNGEFNRAINIIKARGEATSNQVKEFKITNKGIHIEEPYIGQGGMVFGSEKVERALSNKQKYALLKKQLAEIQHQITMIDGNHKSEAEIEYLEKCKIKFELLDKKRDIETELQSIKEINILNQQSREF